MIQLALIEYSPSECWYVGDRLEDEQAAAAAGVDFMWADIWRDRFRSGIYQHAVTPRQLEFLEGIEARK